MRDALAKGPLGFPVVDVAVTLIDGSYHSVDSSELAFRTAAPDRHVARRCRRRSRSCSSRSHGGDRLPDGSDGEGQRHPHGTARPDPGLRHPRELAGLGPASAPPMPEAEIGDLIVELRSATAGAGSFSRQFDRMAEVPAAPPTRSSPRIASRRERRAYEMSMIVVSGPSSLTAPAACLM